MSFIRILLADNAVELRQALATAIAGQPDLVVTGEASGEVDVLLMAARADVVVLGWDGTERALAVTERLLDEYPAIGILAIDLADGRALMYHLVMQVESVGPLTPESLLTAIRRAAGNDTASNPFADSNFQQTPDGEPS